MELLSNRREGSVLSRSSSAAKSGAEFHLRESERSGLSRRHEDRFRRDSLRRSCADRVSICVAGKSIIMQRRVQLHRQIGPVRIEYAQRQVFRKETERFTANLTWMFRRFAVQGKRESARLFN